MLEGGHNGWGKLGQTTRGLDVKGSCKLTLNFIIMAKKL